MLTNASLLSMHSYKFFRTSRSFSVLLTHHMRAVLTSHRRSMGDGRCESMTDAGKERPYLGRVAVGFA